MRISAEIRLEGSGQDMEYVIPIFDLDRGFVLDIAFLRLLFQVKRVYYANRKIPSEIFSKDSNKLQSAFSNLADCMGRFLIKASPFLVDSGSLTESRFLFHEHSDVFTRIFQFLDRCYMKNKNEFESFPWSCDEVRAGFSVPLALHTIAWLFCLPEFVIRKVAQGEGRLLYSPTFGFYFNLGNYCSHTLSTEILLLLSLFPSFALQLKTLSEKKELREIRAYIRSFWEWLDIPGDMVLKHFV